MQDIADKTQKVKDFIQQTFKDAVMIEDRQVGLTALA